MSAPITLSHIDLTIRSAPLEPEASLKTAISAHWQKRLADNPRLFNGSAFLFDAPRIDRDTAMLAATGAPTDYATFLYWRHFRDEMPYHHLFPVGAIVTADDRLLIGRMSDHTANAGRLYPPAGSFDRDDVRAGHDGVLSLDPLANIAREIGEEIGLSIDAVRPDAGWLMLPSTPRAHALVKILRIDATSALLRPAIEHHIARDPHQELADIEFASFATRYANGAASPYVNDLLAYLGDLG